MMKFCNCYKACAIFCVFQATPRGAAILIKRLSPFILAAFSPLFWFLFCFVVEFLHANYFFYQNQITKFYIQFLNIRFCVSGFLQHQLIAKRTQFVCYRNSRICTCFICYLFNEQNSMF